MPRVDATDRNTRRAAATALVLHPLAGGEPHVLFIERAIRRGDRWSGHMALPGGRYAASDRDLAETAARETFEEVGVGLPAPIGRLDDTGGRTSNALVATFVYTLADEPEIVVDPREVQGAVWVPLDHLRAASSATRYFHRGLGPFPAIRFERYTIWGLTHRIISGFFRVIDGR